MTNLSTKIVKTTAFLAMTLFFSAILLQINLKKDLINPLGLCIFIFGEGLIAYLANYYGDLRYDKENKDLIGFALVILLFILAHVGYALFMLKAGWDPISAGIWIS